MKNYSLNKEEQKEFILKYKIVDDKIICYLPFYKKKILNYTKENEEEIIQKMEEQAVDSHKYRVIMEKKKDKNIEKLILLFCLISSNIAFYLINPLNLFIAIEILLLTYLPICISETIKVNSHLKDIEKSIYFLENKKTFNDQCNKTIDKKYQKKIENEIKFDINIIDKFSLEELEKIKIKIENEIYKTKGYDLMPEEPSINIKYIKK